MGVCPFKGPLMWIESHQSLRNHRKTGRLARKLGVSKVTAIGHLHCLWWWCMDNAPDGNLAGIEVEDIADGAEWEGEPSDFCAALCYAGFVDEEDEDDPARLHGWHDYAGKLIEKRQKDAERKRIERRKEDAPAPSPLRSGNVQRTSNGHPRDGAGTVPNLTTPNLTTPNQDEDTPPTPIRPAPPAEPVAPPDGGERVRGLSAIQSSRFDAFWQAYPKKVGKKTCEAWWGKRRPDAELTQTILDSIAAHHQGDQWQRNFIKEPINWLKEERWNDEVTPPPRERELVGKDRDRVDVGNRVLARRENERANAGGSGHEAGRTLPRDIDGHRTRRLPG